MKFWSANSATTTPASNALTSTRSPGTREFDEILSSNKNGSTGNMSNEEFLPMGGSPESNPQRRLKEPIPANRAALIRQIEDENRRLRERRRLRELGYQALLVITIVVSLALLTISLWLFYVAWKGAGEVALTKEDFRRIAQDAVAQAKKSTTDVSNTRSAKNVHEIWEEILEGGDSERMLGKGVHHQLHQRSSPTHYPQKVVSVPKKLAITATTKASLSHRQKASTPATERGSLIEGTTS